MNGFMRMALSRQGGPFVPSNFAVRTYTGNGATRNISNGLMMSEFGGMVITRRRDSPLTGVASDTVTGINNGYYVGSAAARANMSSPTAYLADGYTVGNAAQFNTSGGTYVSWSFKRAQRFFDVVSFTSDGTSNQRVPHLLGQAPGLVMVRAATASSPFYVFVGSMGLGAYGDLSSSAAFASAANAWGTAAPTSTDMGFNGAALGLPAGTACVMYLWADDQSSRGIVRAGTFPTNASGAATLNLGWQPQFFLSRRTDGDAEWEVFDTTRGWTTGTQRILNLNGSAAESNVNSNIVLPTSTGVQITGGWISSTLMYLAIRS